MHQAREIAIRMGFKPERDKYLLWELKAWKKENHQKALVDYQHGDAFLMGQEAQVERIIALLEHIDGWYCIRCGRLDPEEVVNDKICIKKCICRIKKCKLCGNAL